MKFGEKERVRQEAFKEYSNTFSSKARNAGDDKAIRNPYLLTQGCEDENLFTSIRKEAIEFFDNRGIPWWKDVQRTGDIENGKPTRNMASSQVACVNFMLPLAKRRKSLVNLLKVIDPEIIDVLPICRNGFKSFVEFEYVGYKTSLEGKDIKSVIPSKYCTSIDAIIIGAKSNTNHKAFIFEWKYVEEYGKGELKGSNETRKNCYLELFNEKSSPFKKSAQFKFEDFLYDPFYQIMRLLLFSRKLKIEFEPIISDTQVIVICPEKNDEYRNVETPSALHDLFPFKVSVEKLIKDCLVNPEEFSIVDPKTLFKAVCDLRLSDKDWIKYQMLRYGY